MPEVALSPAPSASSGVEQSQDHVEQLTQAVDAPLPNPSLPLGVETQYGIDTSDPSLVGSQATTDAYITGLDQFRWNQITECDKENIRARGPNDSNRYRCVLFSLCFP